MGFSKWFDSLPKVAKFILCLPGLDSIFGALYRFSRGHIIAGLIWLLCGWAILWIVDLATILTRGKITFLA